MTDPASDVRVAPAAHRLEDRRLVRGEGRYLANQPLPARVLHAGIVRSTEPHGVLRGIDAEAALAVPGVVAVLTADDLAGVLGPLPTIVAAAPPYHAIARGRVRYVGEPVAVVLATDAAALADAMDGVIVDVDPLPVVVDLPTAVADGAPTLHDEMRSNVVWERTYRYGDPDHAFRTADRVVRATLSFPRYNSTPLETYSVVASWSASAERYDLHANFQGPFSLLPVLARGLLVAEHQVRMVVPEDIGGSFGIKAMIYPYVALIAACARATGRPVAWVEGRGEHLIGSTSGTERLTEVEVAVRDDGRILAIRTDILEDVGAYLRAPEPSCVMRSLTLFSGPYDIPHGETRARLTLSNRVPTGLNRGYGGQQHSFTVERIVDHVATELGLDAVEVRRRNLVTADQFPHQTASGTIYDSGDYHACLDLALEHAGYAAQREEQARRRADGATVQLGIGIATVVHSSAANIGYVTLALTPEERARPGYRPKSGAHDTAECALLPGGRVRVRIASAGAGQGHATTAGQIAAGVLGLAASDVEVVDLLDTSDPLWGTTSGAYSSRFSVMIGNAVARAAGELRDRLRSVAAAMLEADAEDLVVAGGAVSPKDAPARGLSLRAIAGGLQWDRGSLPADVRADLVCTASFSPPHLEPPDEMDRINAASAYGFMADVAVVEIDVETGAIAVRDYVAVHDVGRALNPTLIHGQIAGGIVHGIGGALFEHVGYADDGQPTGATFLTYLSPSAAEMRNFGIHHHDTPSPFNDLGVKGCGENSAMSAPAAIAAAVEDALAPFGASIDRLPVSPQDVWRVIVDHRQGAAT